MKRVYWSLGSVVGFGVLWWLIPRFVVDVSSKASETQAASRTHLEQASVTPQATEGRSEGEPARDGVLSVNELYASVAPRPLAQFAVVAPPTELSEEELSVVEEVSLLRKPVIDAIRAVAVSKAEKYDRMREALHDSGGSGEGWTRQAQDVFAGWSRQLDGKGGELDSASIRCYLAGCESLVYFDSEDAYDASAAAFRSLSEVEVTHGGRVQTPPKQLEDGRWVAAWLMMRPNVGVE